MHDVSGLWFHQAGPQAAAGDHVVGVICHQLVAPWSMDQQDHADVLEAAVPDRGEHMKRVRRALAAVGSPQPEDVPGAFDRDCRRYVEEPVRDLAVVELHVHAVDEHHRTDRVAGSLCSGR